MGKLSWHLGSSNIVTGVLIRRQECQRKGQRQHDHESRERLEGAVMLSPTEDEAVSQGMQVASRS